jgi:hypothetical protein
MGYEMTRTMMRVRTSSYARLHFVGSRGGISKCGFNMG